MDYHSCVLCPRMCRADRDIQTGYCGSGAGLKAARAALHMWEEPCISGTGGSGTIFFSGCTLRCCFCQNYRISSEGFGKELSTDELSGIILRLQKGGAHNINLVTATQFLPSILPALDAVKPQLHIPVVYNTSGYERPETIEALRGYVEIYLPDLKYMNTALSSRYSKAPDYFDAAGAAVKAMIAQVGPPVLEEDSSSRIKLMKRGVIIRHMVLPGCRKDSMNLLHWIKENLPKKSYYLSLLSQYTPFYHSCDYPEIDRRVTSYEYDKVVECAVELGLTQGYMQQKSSAKEEYTPLFDLEGLGQDGPREPHI